MLIVKKTVRPMQIYLDAKMKYIHMVGRSLLTSLGTCCILKGDQRGMHSYPSQLLCLAIKFSVSGEFGVEE
jgi:hypothetical protein